MDELEQALSVTGLTGDHVDLDDQDDVDQDDHDVDFGCNGMSVQHSIGLIKVVTSYDVIDHVILSYICIDVSQMCSKDIQSHYQIW